MVNHFRSAIRHISDRLGMTEEQYRILSPGGELDRDGYPGTLVTDEKPKTFKERIKEERERNGWKPVR